LDVTPLTVTIPQWPGKALITVTANGGTITWSAATDPGVALSVESPPGPPVPSAYGGTIQNGTSVILAVDSAPMGTSTVTFNPDDVVVTLINPG
jgi:hypothetical protein